MRALVISGRVVWKKLSTSIVKLMCEIGFVHCQKKVSPRMSSN